MTSKCFPQARRAAFPLLALSLTLSSAWPQSQPGTKTDATFVFTSDTHVTFDGTTDLAGLLQALPFGPVFVSNETATTAFPGTPSQDQCTNAWLSFAKDMCNQIQHIRKMNALTVNQWNSTPYLANKHSRSLWSTGSINPGGVIVGGDLTDCAGGNDASSCAGYGGTGETQLQTFEILYDKAISDSQTRNIVNQPFLKGLLNPYYDVPLKYPLYPGLGNHDIDNPAHSGTPVFDYITSTFGMRGLTHADTAFAEYSWDWGNLHMVNVGVYPGSANNFTGHKNYTFSQDALDFLNRDLQTYAGDGRPVVITSHMGFDNIGLDWFDDPDRIAGYQELWEVLRNYNVIGFYHGHSHDSSNAYQYPMPADRENQYGSTHADIPGNTLLPLVPYDIFNSAPGFGQGFVLSRVTDSRMDTMLADYNDFNNNTKQIAFSANFTKILTQAPQVLGLYADRQGDTQLLSFTSGNQLYLLGADILGPFGIRALDQNGKPTAVCTGVFPMGFQQMVTYSVGPTPHVLLSYGSSLVDYSFSTENCLVKNWSSPIVAGAMMTFLSNGDGQPMLLVDNMAQAKTLNLYTMTASGAQSIAAIEPPDSLNSGPSMQLAALQSTASGTLRFIRYFGNSAEYLSLDLSTYRLTLSNSETGWAGRRVAVVSSPAAMWPEAVAANSQPNLPAEYLNLAMTIQAPYVSGASYPDSPYYVRTVLQDDSGSDVSWRGQIPQMAQAAVDFIPVSQTPNGLLMVAYNSAGWLVPFTLQWPSLTQR